MNTVGVISIIITPNCIYIYIKVEFYNLNGKANLHSDFKKVNLCLIIMIVWFYFDKYVQKNPSINL